MRQKTALCTVVMTFLLVGCSVSVRPIEVRSSVSPTETWNRVSTPNGLKAVADEALSRVIIGTDSIYECPARDCGATRYIACPVVEEMVQGSYVSGHSPTQRIQLVHFGRTRFYRIPEWYGQDTRPTVSYHMNLYGPSPGTVMVKHPPRTISDKNEMRRYFGLECRNGGPVSVQ